MSTKTTISNRIAQLDPVQDHQEIVFLLNCHVFPWDIERSLEFALFRTFAVPSISKLLSETEEFKKRPRKRYDDTELILYEIIEHGYDSERAQQAFRRMNRMHGTFNISNSDFLYVLGTFIFEPIDWINTYGKRQLTHLETEAFFLFFKEMGKRMAIRDIPETLDAFRNFKNDYEQQHFLYTDTNRKVADATMNLLLSFYLPRWLHWMGRPLAYSFMDGPLLKAMDFPTPSPIMRGFVKGLMGFRAWLLRGLPERTKPLLGTQRRRPTYPEGYEIEGLGTFPKRG